MEGGSGVVGGAEDVLVGGEDEVVLEDAAEVGVAASGFDVEGVGCGGVDGEVEGHGEAEGVKARAKVGGGSGEPEVKGPG
jgi:hypothetical protein